MNERNDYAQFLDSHPTEYEVFTLDDVVIGPYGLIGIECAWRGLNWILISPKAQDIGIGSKFMNRVISVGKTARLIEIKIAISHLSAPFISKHSATQVREIENG